MAARVGNFALRLLALSGLGVAAAWAHPMPNTEIVIARADDGLRFELAIPLPELRLALPQQWPRDSPLLEEPYRGALLRYFDAHFWVAAGPRKLPHRIESLASWRTANPDVGEYEELRVSIAVPTPAGIALDRFTLFYDCVIHQVPNHYALVHEAQAGDGGQATAGGEIAVIRYDFVRNLTPEIGITLGHASSWRTLRSAVALGFHHVVTGFDHLLFLLCLLIVAPLRVRERQWTLFQGWGHTMQRFLGISLAFTTGHSLALVMGVAWNLPLAGRPVEVLIAVSILVAAVHAIRPLFTGREWLVAALFGTVHGLAFAAGIAGMVLTTASKAMVVFGFNLGVEAAQLAAMAAAIPLLFASRARWFPMLRVATMSMAAILACLWGWQRLA